MTHSLGKNTCNVPINMDVRERAVWGRVACQEGKSFGEFWREMALSWARQNRPEVATAVEDVRRCRRETIRTSAAIFMFVIQLGITVDWMATNDEWELRRPSKGGMGRVMRQLRTAKGREIEA